MEDVLKPLSEPQTWLIFAGIFALAISSKKWNIFKLNLSKKFRYTFISIYFAFMCGISLIYYFETQKIAFTLILFSLTIYSIVKGNKDLIEKKS